MSTAGRSRARPWPVAWSRSPSPTIRAALCKCSIPRPTSRGFELSGDGWVTVLRLGSGIASAVLSAGGQTVELTLDTAPSGPLQLRYLHGQNAFGHKATPEERRPNGNTLYDDYVYHPARPGLPINGTVAPIDVTP